MNPRKVFLDSSGKGLFTRNEIYPVSNIRTDIITGRNEVVAKVMFLLVSVILSTGGSAAVHAGILPLPPEGGTHQEGDNPQEGDPPEGGTPPKKEAPP